MPLPPIRRPSSLSATEAWGVFALGVACTGIIINTIKGVDGSPVIVSVAFSGIAFAVTLSLVRWLIPVFLNAGLKGRDMAKPGRPEMYVYREEEVCSLSEKFIEYMLIFFLLMFSLDQRLWVLFAQLCICYF